jgi:3-oxoacyl-[acyl-carrier protein] reductase
MNQQDNTSPLFGTGVAFVAGGSGGIGSAICIALAEAGSNVSLSYNRNLESARQVQSAVTKRGRFADIRQLSLQDSDATRAAIEEIAARHGAIHTVIYAVGPHVPLKFMSKVAPEEFKSFLLGDTFAFYNLVHAALPHLRKSRGSIVAVTTTAIARWAPQDGLSAVPKAAVDRLLAGIAREEGRFGVRANSVALGIIDAGMFKRTMESGQIDGKYMDAMAVNVPLRRMGTAEEAASAVVFLASSRAAYTTGTVLRVDGGYAV